MYYTTQENKPPYYVSIHNALFCTCNMAGRRRRKTDRKYTGVCNT